MKISIIGLGYVGLPLAVEFAKKGHQVVGIDIDSSRVERLKTCNNYIGDVSDEDLKIAIRNRLFVPSTSYEGCNDAHAVIICVPTPISEHKDPDLSAIRAA